MAATRQAIRFPRHNQWFRYRASGIIIKDDAALMVGNDHNDYYYSVGGAVQLGDTAEEACLRELHVVRGLTLENGRSEVFSKNLLYKQCQKSTNELKEFKSVVSAENMSTIHEN